MVATYTWKGGAGATTPQRSRWRSGPNWTTGIYPGSSQTTDTAVIVAATYGVIIAPGTTTTIGELDQYANTITASGGALIISTNGATTSGALNQYGGTLNVRSTLNAAGTVTVGTIVAAGSIVQSGTTNTLIRIAGGTLSTAALTQSGSTPGISNAVTLSSGTLTISGLLTQSTSTATLDVSGSGVATTGSISQSAGTISITGGSLTNAGTLDQTGGTIDVGGSGVLTTGAVTQDGATALIDVSTGGTFTTGSTNFTQSAGSVELTGGSLNVGGLLTQTAGTISVSGGRLTAGTLAGSGSIGITGGLLDVTGTLTDSGAITIGAGTLEAATLTQSAGSITFTATGGTLEIGDASGDATIDLGSTSADGTVFWNNAATTGDLSYLTLANFLVGDKLEIATAGPVTNDAITYSGDNTAGTLTITGTIGGNAFTDTVYITTPGAPPLSSDNFSLSSGSGYLEIDTTACFLRGTRIATLRGQVAVEDLRIGDLVVTATGGGAQPVKWIGTRGFVTKLVNQHHRAAQLPIRIAAGALGEASPVRDLYVSPEHMMCLDDVLIPAGKLLNGTTINRAENIDVVQYFHIELPRHAVLYAEGAPTESFLDTGNRNMFANVLSYLELGHDLDAPPQPACLPIVTDGEALAAVRARLAGRAASTGLTTTEDDDLHLLVDGAALRPEQRQGDTARFTVAAGARQVRIVSRSVAPADLDPTSGDLRRLGIAFSGMSLHDGSFALDLAPGYAGFATGFHASEGGHRWTAGDALLPEDLTAAMPDGFVLELKLIRTGLRYAAPAQTEAISFAPRHAAVRLTERLSA